MRKTVITNVRIFDGVDGITPTQANAVWIEGGRISRLDALEIVRKRDGKFPWTYLHKPLADILAPLEMTVDEFVRICDQFTNKKIFKRDASGALLKDKRGNLEKLNYDNV